MEIYIFSDNEKISSNFSAVEKSKEFNLKVMPVDKFRQTAKKLNHCEMIYLDISGMNDSDRKKNINFMSKLKFVRCGIIDPSDSTDSISHLFHMGFSDYLESRELNNGITPQRLKENIQFKTCHLPPVRSDGARIRAKEAPDSWSGIEDGEEYTFCLLFLRIDRIKEMKRNYGHKFIEQLTRKYLGLFEKSVSAHNGKIWNWDINKGVALFPYNDRCGEIILSGFRFIRDSILLSAEYLHSPVKLEFTIIVHLGNLEYHERGKTGTTVSESMNLLYHAAELMAKPGNYYLSQNMASYTPEEIEDLFVDAGEFEGYSFKRMKRINT